MRTPEFSELKLIGDRFIEALDRSGEFWVEAHEWEGLKELRLTVTDKETDCWFIIRADMFIQEN